MPHPSEQASGNPNWQANPSSSEGRPPSRSTERPPVDRATTGWSPTAWRVATRRGA